MESRAAKYKATAVMSGKFSIICVDYTECQINA